MQDQPGVAVGMEYLANPIGVSQIRSEEGESTLRLQPLQVTLSAWSREIVDDNYFIAPCQVPTCCIAPDEASAAGNDYFHSLEGL
jgi:hypothetical protein